MVVDERGPWRFITDIQLRTVLYGPWMRDVMGLFFNDSMDLHIP
jgi:hypothetical protein